MPIGPRRGRWGCSPPESAGSTPALAAMARPKKKTTIMIENLREENAEIKEILRQKMREDDPWFELCEKLEISDEFIVSSLELQTSSEDFNKYLESLERLADVINEKAESEQAVRDCKEAAAMFFNDCRKMRRFVDALGRAGRESLEKKINS